jgi:hypothetical protein
MTVQKYKMTKGKTAFDFAIGQKRHAHIPIAPMRGSSFPKSISIGSRDFVLAVD